MGVLIKKNDKFDDLQSTSFPLELDLSKLIIYNPEVFPIRNYSEEGEKWFPVSVEVGLETGELDILGIDDAGGIYIIESKLFQIATEVFSGVTPFAPTNSSSILIAPLCILLALSHSFSFHIGRLGVAKNTSFSSSHLVFK